jgi:hypothetical protein
MEAFSIASAVVSLVIGAFAIWLSIVFYRMSVESSNRIQESAKDLSSSVSRLEKLFDHLYSDTFAVMRDTYSDMRKHVWPETVSEEPEVVGQIEARADSKINNIRAELMEQIGTIAAEVGGTDAKVDQLSAQLSPLVDDAISRSRNAEAEAREETLRDVLISIVRSAGRRGITAWELSNVVQDNPSWGSDFFPELERLRREGIIRYEPDSPEKTMPAADDRVIYTPGQSRKGTEKLERPTNAQRRR